MTAMFSQDRTLAAARRLLSQSIVLAFRSDAVLQRIDALQRRHQREAWELENFLAELHARLGRPTIGAADDNGKAQRRSA